MKEKLKKAGSWLKTQLTTFPMGYDKWIKIIVVAYILFMLIQGGSKIYMGFTIPGSGWFDAGWWQIIAAFFYVLWFLEMRLVRSAHQLTREVFDLMRESDRLYLELEKNLKAQISELQKENDALKGPHRS